MAGIYVHVPFCRRACHYCDFHFTTNLKNQGELVEALIKEITLRKEYLNGEPIETIYFGGGTPSLLSNLELERILNSVSALNSIASNAEITLEANPEDLTEEKLQALHSMGINRLSLGTQSFINSELKWMNRMHTSVQAAKAIGLAQRIGFDNISIDLIFGLPDQTLKDWKHNLKVALDIGVQHISSYGLTVENRTVLSNQIKKGLQAPPNDELAIRMFEMNMEVFPENGFEHYEVSNFAREGFISRHNSSYWKGVPYLGIGPSAHSFNGKTRQWNVRSNAAYIEAISSGKSYSETEELTVTDRLNELIMIGLRTKWGISKSEIENVRPVSWQHLLSAIPELETENFILESDNIRLSKKGMLMADRLASELFFEE